MTKKRSRLEMYLNVLETVDMGVDKPTNIMYKCNLSWVPMQEILALLIGKSLIREVESGSKKTYEITERGRDLLRYLGTVVDVLATQRRKGTAFSEPRPRPPSITRLRRDLLMVSQEDDSAESDSS